MQRDGLVVIPIYNERDVWKDIIRRLAANAEYEDLLLIDDGTESSLAIPDLDNLTVIRHHTNSGYGYSIWEGLLFAIEKEYHYVITIDGDGQHLPESIQLFRSKVVEQKIDLVLGSRYLNSSEEIGQTPYSNRITNTVITQIINTLSNSSLTDVFCGYRAYRTKNLKGISPTDLNWGFTVEILLQCIRQNLSVVEVPIPRIYHYPLKIHPFPIDTLSNSLDYYSRIIWDHLRTLENSSNSM